MERQINSGALKDLAVACNVEDQELRNNCGINLQRHEIRLVQVMDGDDDPSKDWRSTIYGCMENIITDCSYIRRQFRSGAKKLERQLCIRME